MSLVMPIALAMLAAVLPIGLAYLWSKRTEKRRVSSVLILKKIALATEPPRRGISQPKHVVSFILIALALAAATLAAADMRRDREKPVDLVVVLDTSASMGTLEEDGKTRLDLARERLRAAVHALRTGDRVALVTTGATTVVRVGLTEHTTHVLDVAASLTPGGTSDRAASAIELADGICRSAGDARILLLSDGVGVDVPKTTCTVENEIIGTNVANAGISELSIREGDAFGTHEVHVAVTSVLRRAKRAEIAILAGPSVVDLATIDLPAKGKVERLLRLELPPGAEISAELRLGERDALAEDDYATASRVEGGRVRALLVSGAERSFVGEALRIHPRVELTKVKAGEPIPPGTEADLVVLEALPAGGMPKSGRNLVTLGLPPAAVGLPAGEAADKPEIVRWAYQDPLFRYVDLQGLKVPSGTVLQPAAGQRTLIDTEHGAIAVLDARPERNLLYMGFAPHETDFVLRVGFVNFVANLVEWAAEGTSVGERKGVLSATESWVHPPDSLAGTESPERPRLDLPLWRIALLAAFGLLLTELLTQTVAGSRTQVTGFFARLRARRRNGPADGHEKGGAS